MFVGREKEFEELDKLVSDSLKKSFPLSIYISGVPGTGKTAVTTAVIQKLQKKKGKFFKVMFCFSILEIFSLILFHLIVSPFLIQLNFIAQFWKILI